MTLKLNFMLFAAITVMMTACDKNDEPLNRTQFEIEREAPVRATPLLANYAQQHDGLTMWPSTVVDDSRLTGEAGDYSYWQEHKNEAQTTEELMAMCDIPSDKLHAMSTANLARTCYNHPYAVSSKDNILSYEVLESLPYKDNLGLMTKGEEGTRWIAFIVEKDPPEPLLMWYKYDQSYFRNGGESITDPTGLEPGAAIEKKDSDDAQKNNN